LREWLKPSLRLGAALAALGLTIAPATAGAFTIEAASERASHIYFATDEPLLPSVDTDDSVDVYDRSNGELHLATAGDPACRPGCGNGEFDVVADNGVKALSDGGLLFSTAESLSSADEDSGGLDIYRRSPEGPQLLSTTAAAPKSADDAVLKSYSADGSAIVYATAEPLLEEDTDSSIDVYRRVGAITTLVSKGEKGFNGPFDALWAASSEDQGAVLFRTAEQLANLDTDNSIDLYRYSFGETTWMSRGAGDGATGNGEFDVGPDVLLNEEGRVVFETTEVLQADNDEDETQDVYMNYGGTITNVSEGSHGIDPSGSKPAELNEIDPRADQVIFSSAEVLNFDEDRDVTGEDVYEWYFGKTILESRNQVLLTPPTIDATFLDYIPSGLGRVIFETPERLLEGDTDNEPDIYERINLGQEIAKIFKRVEGKTKLVSQGLDGFNGPFSHHYEYASPDGEELFFTTRERLVGADTDSALDLYVRRGGSTTELVSAGLINGNGPFDVTSQGGVEHPLFTTSEPLVSGDQDTEPDLYERDGGDTRLVSTAKPGPPAPTITGSSPAPPANSRTPAFRGEAEASSIVEVFVNDPTCTGEPAGSGTTAQFTGSGITVNVPANTATTVYARTSDSENNPGPCSAGFVYVEDSTSPALSGTSLQSRTPANDNFPVLRGSTEADAVVRVFASPACDGDPLSTGSGAQLGSPGISAQVADDSVTELSMTSTDAAGNVSSCVGPFRYVEDSTPPKTGIRSGPRKKRSRSRNPLFRFWSNEEDVTFSCRLDRRAPAPCSEFAVIRRVGRGRHVLSVVATDTAGNTDATPARWPWKMAPAKARRHQAHRRHRRHGHRARHRAH
jgi:hypothetical protein